MASNTDAEMAAARLRLALRAEAAWGQRLVHAQLPPEAGEPVETFSAESVARATPTRSPAKSPPTRTKAAKTEPQPAATAAEPLVDLFGNPVAAKSESDTPPSDDPFPAPPPELPKRIELLQKLDAEQVKGCTKCPLHEGRTHTVFGEGDPAARLMFIGEGPGQNEDETGRPFVGRAGEMLSKWIEAMGLRREQVYIANVVKCRPPNNREPTAMEVSTCTPYLHEQLEWIRPEVIVTLGRPSTQHLLQVKSPMKNLRGKWHTWRGLRVMPTYHPAYLLRAYTPANRRIVWDDLRTVAEHLGLKPAGG